MTIALAFGLAAGCTCAERHGGDAGAARDAATPDAGTDAALDAGVDAGWPDAATANDCFDAIHSVEGAPCAFAGSCLVGDLCCGGGAQCWDGRVVHASAPLTCEGEVRTTMCGAAAASARGATPLGAIAYEHAFASFTFAFAVDVVVLFTREPSFAVCDGDRLAVWLTPRFDEVVGNTYVGTHEVVAQLVAGGALERAPATVTVTRYDADGTGRIVGTLRVTAPEWDVTADFDVAGCAEIDRSGP
ncbi:MAG: hypothetical protein KF729_38630 [Sandaracinaceae bacterium]|nr:hypothetical protein [Sandaracinaceae bacterium]